MLRSIFLLLFIFNGAAGSQTTNSVSTVAAPQAIPLVDVVPQAEASEDVVKQTENGLVQLNQNLSLIGGELPSLAQDIDRKLADEAALISGSPTLDTLQRASSSWGEISKRVSGDESTLTREAGQVSTMIQQLNQKDQIWKLTQPEVGEMPTAVGTRVTTLVERIEQTQKSAKNIQSSLLDLQSRLADQRKRVELAMKNLSVAQNAARDQLLMQDSPPIWDSALGGRGEIAIHEGESLEAQLDALRIYFEERIGSFCSNLVLLVFLCALLFRLRKIAQERTNTGVELSRLEVLNMPISTAFLCAIIASHWLYPLAPRLLIAILDASAIIPAVIVLRRILQPTLFSILYAIVAAYFIDLLRSLLVPAGTLSRFTYLFEVLAATLFLLWLLHSHKAVRDKTEAVLRLSIHFLFVVLLSAGMANAFGYVHLSEFIGGGTLQSCYIGLIIYAIVRVIEPLSISFIGIKSFDAIRLLKSHRDDIHHRLRMMVRSIAVGIWLFEVLYLFSLLTPVREGIRALLATKLYWGSLSISIGSLLAGAATIWGAFFISRFARFVLEAEVYPRMQLTRGIAYSISSMVHYSVLVLGFLAALGAIGIDSSKLLVFAGALGVGLGFGLQNIVNNFVAGIILLFERPIKIGDTIQVDTSIGVVERIGIRASVVRLSNGSELILPNGNLISNPVTNWSLSSSNRIVEIPVSVSSKVDPKQIMTMLKEVAFSDPRVLREPEPQVLVTSLTAAGLTFRVRVWIGTQVDSLEITSDLSLAINACLTKNNVALS